MDPLDAASAPDPLSTIFHLARSRTTPHALHALPTTAAPADVQAALAALPASLPSHGLGTHEALRTVLRDVVPALAPGHAGPRYFGFVTGGTLPSSQLADFLTTLYDQNVIVNRPEESIAAVLEARALEFVLDLFQLPRAAFPARTLTTGGTAANILGLALAREHAVRHALASATHSVAEDGFAGVTVKVYSDRPHASLVKAAATVGIGRANVVDLGRPLDDGGETVGIALDELEGHLGAAAPGSGTAAVVALSFGEVNTGDFTPHVREIRALCERYGVWLHIDAAFGACARLVPELVGPVADGLELADSIAADAHKWLNVPYDCGLFFSRTVAHQQAVFGPSPAGGAPAYLARAGAPPSASVPDPMTLGLENSRRFRGLPLYTALLDQGRAGYAGVVGRNVRFARRVAGWMGSAAGKGYYTVLNLRGGRPPLNVVLFRAGRGNPVGAYGEAGVLVRAVNATRRVQVTAGSGGGDGGAVRMAVANWSTGEDDFGVVVEVLLGVVERPPGWVGV